jgi:hypothetical protein
MACLRRNRAFLAGAAAMTPVPARARWPAWLTLFHPLQRPKIAATGFHCQKERWLWTAQGMFTVDGATVLGPEAHN